MSLEDKTCVPCRGGVPPLKGKALTEEQGHHPDILLAWGKAEITLWTHKIDGLTESDFIMAAKIDRLPRS